LYLIFKYFSGGKVMRSYRAQSIALGCLALLSLSVASAAEPVTGATVAIDPATGKMRPVEHDDALKAAQAQARRASAFGATAGAQSSALNRLRQAAKADQQVKIHSNGTISLRSSLEDMEFSVATRQADGTITNQCVHGEDAAAHAMHAHTHTGGADVQ
jgi:hypothetical protein